MSRITKTIAEEVAIKMSKPIKLKREKKQEELNKLVVECYLKTIPKEVVKMSELHPKYFKKNYSFSLVGNGFNHNRISLSQSVVSSDNYSIGLALGDVDADRILPVYREWEDLGKEYDEFKKSVEVALLGLKTYNKVKLEFSEAYEFLPEKEETGLSIPLQNIREKLQQYAPKENSTKEV